eukprot:38546-Rhodomonas_salina.1
MALSSTYCAAYQANGSQEAAVSALLVLALHDTERTVGCALIHYGAYWRNRQGVVVSFLSRGLLAALHA